MTHPPLSFDVYPGNDEPPTLFVSREELMLVEVISIAFSKKKSIMMVGLIVASGSVLVWQELSIFTPKGKPVQVWGYLTSEVIAQLIRFFFRGVGR